jgi:hypothetical protein
VNPAVSCHHRDLIKSSQRRAKRGPLSQNSTLFNCFRDQQQFSVLCCYPRLHGEPAAALQRTFFLCARTRSRYHRSFYKRSRFPCETKRYWSQRGVDGWVGVAKLWSHRDLGESLHNKTARKGKFARSSPRFQMRRTLRYISLYLLLHWQCDDDEQKMTRNTTRNKHPWGFSHKVVGLATPLNFFFPSVQRPLSKRLD